MNLHCIKQKTDMLFYAILAIGGASFSAIVLILWISAPYMSAIARSLILPAVTLCDCAAALQVVGEPMRGVFMLVLNTLLTILLLFGVYTAWRLLSSTKKFLRQFDFSAPSITSAQLRKAIQAIGLQERYVKEMASNQLIAFCAGLIRPRLYISRQLLEKLTFDELTILIRHEDLHRKMYEPLRLFIVKFLQAFFFFIPGFSKLASYYTQSSELAADEYATEGFTNNRPLAGALYKIVSSEKERRSALLLPLSFFSAILGERIRVLSGEKYSPKLWKLFIRGMAGAMPILFIPLLMAEMHPVSTKVNTKYLPTACHMNENLNPTRCALPREWSCKMQNKNIFCVANLTDV